MFFYLSSNKDKDKDIFENGPRVEADLFYTDKKRCVFKKIRIRVDGAFVTIPAKATRKILA